MKIQSITATKLHLDATGPLNRASAGEVLAVTRRGKVAVVIVPPDCLVRNADGETIYDGTSGAVTLTERR
jgi:antitoxin (DNA-binding transcriptional repressor) of toxin-antitoxin stability system